MIDEILCGGLHVFEYREYVYAVHKEKSFTKAADKLFISQSTLSLMVKKEEERLGAPLFNRKSNPLSLTPLGVEYIHAVEQIRRLECGIGQFLNDAQSLQNGTLAIGGHNFGVDYAVPRKIAEFHKLYPNISLSIVEMNTLHNKYGLDSGELDFVITNRRYDSHIYEQKVCDRESLILAVPSSFEINESLCSKRLRNGELGDGIFGVGDDKQVLLSEFKEIPFILLSNANYLRECVNLLFHESKFSPVVSLEMEQSSVSYNFTKMGVGATILSNRLVEHDDAAGGVCFYKIKSDYVVRNTYISYRRGAYFTFAMKKFMEMMLDDGLSAE